LTAATFALDALIELRGRHRNRIRAWLLGRPQPQWEASAPEPIREIVRLLRTAQVDPARAGVKARQDAWPTPALETGADYIAHLFDAIGNRKLPEPSHQYWRVLFDITLQALEKQRQEGDDRGVDDHTEWEHRRAIRAVLVMTLVALHSRVDAIRRRPSATHALPERSGSMDQFLTRDIARLLRDLEREIEKYAY